MGVASELKCFVEINPIRVSQRCISHCTRQIEPFKFTIITTSSTKYQILKGAYDIDHQLFTPSTCTTTRGHTKKLFKYHVNSHTRSKFFGNRVINDWNSLPQFIIDSSSVNEFKMLLDRHYSNYLFDYV